MRVAIDIKSTLKDKTTGIGSYTLRLIKALTKVDRENRYLLFGHCSFLNFKKEFPLKGLPDNFKLRKKRLSGKTLFFLLKKMKLPLDYFLGEVDIFQTTEAKYPHPKKAKLVHFLADLIPLARSEFYSREEVNRFKEKTLELLDKTDGLIMPSYATQKDLIKFFPDFNKPTAIIPIGIDEDLNLADKSSLLGLKELEGSHSLDKFCLQDIREKYALGGKIILCVGTIEARKNYETVIRAFSRIKKKQPDYQLVIAGEKIPGWEKLLDLCRDLNVSQRIIFTGYVSKKELVGFYNLAELFVYPSLYEGYGLPPLEAMVFGVPVIVSKNSSLVETAGEAGMFFEADEVSDLVSKMEAVLTSPFLRETLKIKGFKRVKELSLEDMGKKTVNFYEQILEK